MKPHSVPAQVNRRMMDKSTARLPPQRRANQKNDAYKQFVSHGRYQRWDFEEQSPTQRQLRTPVSSPEMEQLTRMCTLRTTRLFCASQRVGFQPPYVWTEDVGPRAHGYMRAPAKTWEPCSPPAAEEDYDPAIFRNGFCDEFLCTNPVSAYGLAGYECLYFEDEPAEVRVWTDLINSTE